MHFRKLAVVGSVVLFGISLSACGDDSSSGPSGDDGKKTDVKTDSGSLLPEVSGDGCDFKKDDKVWSYAIKSSYEGLNNETYRYYIYNEKGFVSAYIDNFTGEENTTHYEYTYDSYDNWVTRRSDNNFIVRKITYYE